ncbi:hypothetical protein M2436_004591 [Streptomyces sp. HB372]|nr:hypothetical protein [Streptomyces sp. HB372]
MRDARGDLQRRPRGLQRGRRRPGQRRRIRLRIEDPAASAPPCRVHEDRVVRGGVDLRDIGAPHLDQILQAERLGVGAGHLGGQRVAVHGQDGDSGAGQGEGVAADAAAQVGHAPHAEPGEPRGAVGGDGGAGGLLDPVGREVHPVGVLGPELGHRPLPQPGLAQGRRHQLRRVRAAQPGRRGQLVGGVVVAQLGQQLFALGGA